jgi:hypothetical protein
LHILWCRIAGFGGMRETLVILQYATPLSENMREYLT